MPTRYNLIAGHSVERLAALSDGVFAVAMTLLVLDLHAPAEAAIHSESDLLHALIGLLPRVWVYVLSFATLGIFWVGQQTQLNHLARTDRSLTWMHLGFLLAVSMTPFSTALMAEFIEYRTALLLYWANILVLGLMLLACWRCAQSSRLLKPDTPAELLRGVERRILIAQALYACGALLCVIDTRISLVLIVLVQLNYVIAPRIGFLQRL